MKIDQAYKILDYGTIPEDREEQINLIGIMGYTRLRGGNLVQDCPDRQLRRVAERLFRLAEKKADAELKQMHEEEDIAEYHHSLCDYQNIPESRRENYTIKGLEEQLMQ